MRSGSSPTLNPQPAGSLIPHETETSPKKDVEVPEDRQKRRKALLIGINYVTLREGQRGRLKESHNDVGIIKKLLIEIYNYSPEDITIMKDHDETPDHLQPNSTNTEKQMTDLVADPREGDEFFIYYAGHAIQQEEGEPNTERDHKDEYIVPMDAMDEDGEPDQKKAIIDDRLKEILIQPLIDVNVKCQLIAFMDTCTSGTLLDLDHDQCNQVIGFRSLCYRILRSVLEVPPERDSNFRATIAGWLRDPTYSCNRLCNRERSEFKANIVCISACEDSQTLMEHASGKTLARTLNDILREHPRPTLKQLSRYLDKDFRKSYGRIWDVYLAALKEHKRGLRPLPDRPVELNRPQITSLRPLKMNTTFRI